MKSIFIFFQIRAVSCQGRGKVSNVTGKCRVPLSSHVPTGHDTGPEPPGTATLNVLLVVVVPIMVLLFVSFPIIGIIFQKR